MEANKERFDNAIEEYEQLGYWEPLTLGQQLSLWAEKYQYRVALVEDETRITYREFDRKVDELASGFFNLGIMKG